MQFLDCKNTIRSVEFLNCVNVPFKPLMLNNYSLSILVAMDNSCTFLCFPLWILWFHQGKELNQAVINSIVLV